MPAFSNKDKQGVALITLVLVALAAIAAVAFSLSSAPKGGADNCVAPVVSKTAILIDRSDAITRQASDEIVRRALDFVHRNVPVNGRVAVFEITNESTTALSPIFEACKPKEQGNQLYEDARAIKKQYANKFENPLREALARPATNTDASPLSEVLTDISLSTHLNADRSNLIIYSDMLQHSKNTSLYNCLSAASAIDNFRRNRTGAQERPEFKNTAIVLNVIPREGLGHEVIKCRDGFWAWFFGDDEGPGASLVTSYLPGGAALK